jgi:hypothetical protein
MPARAVGGEWKDQLASRLDVALQNNFDSSPVGEGWHSDATIHFLLDIPLRGLALYLELVILFVNFLLLIRYTAPDSSTFSKDYNYQR